MQVGESKVKFVKRANMWVKTTLLNRIWTRSKKGTGNYLKDKYSQEWFNENPTQSVRGILKEEDIYFN